MSLTWDSRTQVVSGIGAAQTWLRALPTGRATTLMVDPALVDSEVVVKLSAELDRLRFPHETVVLEAGGDLDSVGRLARHLEEAGDGLHVVVSGGSGMDQAKVATTLMGQPEALEALATTQRSGAVQLPPTRIRRVPLMAIPTTVGTGSEVSSVACLQCPSRKRLLLGNSLPPDLAVLDPVATRTLPAHLLMEGVLEILFRLSSPFISASDRELPIEDALALALVGQLGPLGHEISHSYGAATDSARMDVARLSAMSHMPWLTVARNRFSAKGWYVANELSTVLGTRKMTSIAALLPSIWQRAMDGHLVWGVASKVDQLWSVVRTSYPVPLPHDPVAGICVLMDDWGVDRHLKIDPVALRTTAKRSVRFWGGGLPMLMGVTSLDVQELLSESLTHVPTELRIEFAKASAREPMRTEETLLARRGGKNESSG